MEFIKRAKTLFTNLAFLKVFVANLITIIIILTGLSLYDHAGKTNLENGVVENKVIVADIANNRLVAGEFYNKDSQSKSLSSDILKKLAGKTEEGLKGISDKPAVPQKATKKSFRAPALSPEDQKKNKIVILIDNLGLSKSITLDALKLPTNITLGFSPYANNLQEWLEHAVYQGFEVMINLPMQPTDYPIDDPGPYALLHNLSGYENLKRLNWVLNRTDKAVGLYSSEGEIYSNSRANMTPVFEKLKEMGQIFLYGGDRNAKVLRNIADNMQLEYANNSLIIDRVLQSQEIKSNFYKLESIAQIRGSAVGIMRAYPMNIKLLKEWMANLQANKNLIVVPISNLFKAADPGSTASQQPAPAEDHQEDSNKGNATTDQPINEQSNTPNPSEQNTQPENAKEDTHKPDSKAINTTSYNSVDTPIIPTENQQKQLQQKEEATVLIAKKAEQIQTPETPPTQSATATATKAIGTN
jgi:polysaccharide deacetylase 2 family uncharacterized protein YibQ